MPPEVNVKHRLKSFRSHPGDETAGIAWSPWELAPLPLLLVLFLLRAWRLGDLPSNVTGDEVTLLTDIVRILNFPERVNPLSVMGDGSHSGINVYFMALLVSVFPEEHAVLGMRLASSLLSIVVLAAFYVYLRTKFSVGPSLSAALLLGTNYVFLNLSRSTWLADGKGLGLTCGILAFLLVERGLSKRKVLLVTLGGAVAGLGLYSYPGTMLFPVASLAYFLYLLLRRRLAPRTALVHGGVYLAAALLVFLPNLVTISQDYDRYSLRSKSVYIGSFTGPYYGESATAGILWHQLSYTVRGFLLLDPTVGGVDVENARVGPEGEGPVDQVTRVFFFGGILTALLLHRRDLFQPTVAFLLVLATTQLLTVFPPNYMRGVFGIVFVFVIVAVLLDKLWSVEWWHPWSRLGLALLVAAISLWNVQHYFEWSSGPKLSQAREPAIRYEQVALWIAVQKERMAAGEIEVAITSEEWQQLIRETPQDGGPLERSTP